jgi:hypothetical protein
MPRIPSQTFLGLLGVVWLPLLMAAPHALAGEACSALVQSFNAALDDQLESAAGLARDISTSADCPVAIRSNAQRLTALAYMRAADGIQEPAKQLSLLETGARLAPVWQVMKRIGDLRQRVPNSTGAIDYGAASLAYQAALTDPDSVHL